MTRNFQSSANHILPTGRGLGAPVYCFLPRPKTPPQIVFIFEVSGYTPVLSKQDARDCMDRIQAAFKDIPRLDLQTSWVISGMSQDATQDQAEVGESSSSDSK